MKRAFLRDHGKSGLALVEEAFVLLRTCPLPILAAYYLGAVPFAAGFLIFCSHLSRHPAAYDHLAGATLGMTALFVWMKFFQAGFASMLLARLRGEAPPSWLVGGTVRSICLQTVTQSTGLFVIPLAAIILLPFGWAYAFYQNISVLDDGKNDLRSLIRSAAQQSNLWPAQNHIVLLALSSFGLFVFLNWITLLFFFPQLLKMLFGIESSFTHSPLSLFNTTFFAATIALTYLSVDPLIKAAYVLRVFYGKSLQSGDDLKTAVRRLSGRTTTLAATLVVCFLSPTLLAATSTPAPVPTVASGELDQSIRTVIQQERYTWRAPREKPARTKDGLLSGFFDGIFRLLKKSFTASSEFVEKIIDWLLNRDRSASDSSSNPSWAMPQLGLLFVVLAIFACWLAIAALRIIQSRRISAMAQATAIASIPDLENEDTAADELPEDGWTQMGRSFLEKGDHRLALRAFYLASLAHLASRGLITIARAKSNHDYEREVLRRSHAIPDLPGLFCENVSIFDRIWYGLHEVNPELVQHFVGNLEKMKVIV